jgi:hypothetical protein
MLCIAIVHKLKLIDILNICYEHASIAQLIPGMFLL